jgi:hypothetical protein
MPLNYSLTPVEKEPVGDATPPVGKVIFTIFAGRKRYLECLTRYLDTLLKRGFVTEVHLWDYVRDPADRNYLHELTQKKGYIYMKPQAGMRNWDAYYAYYTKSEYAEHDILIKCDDDVVYLDVDMFAEYLNEVREGGLYFPNIVNNDACGYIQVKYGVHQHISDVDIVPEYGLTPIPMTGTKRGWYQRHDRAVAIHEEFLKNPDKFKINARPVIWAGRISINMFAGRFNTIKKYYAIYLKHRGSDDDEGFLTVNLFRYTPGVTVIVPFFRAVHFAFGPQGVSALDTAFLEKYKHGNGLI